MDSRRLERIILIILALLNVFLLSVVLSDGAEARRSRSETIASVTAMLAENGIAVSDGAVELRSAPVSCVLTRDVSREGEKVRKLIGDYTPEDMGGNIIYSRGEHGQALLRGSGEMDVLLNAGTVPLRGGTERTVHRLLRSMGGGSAVPTEPGGADYYCCFENLPVFNAVLSFGFTDNSLTILGGTRLFDAAVKSEASNGMDSVSALLRFVEIVRSEGYICSRLDGMQPGYLMNVTRSGEAELIPVWRIETDTGPLMIDAESGKVENRLT